MSRDEHAEALAALASELAPLAPASATRQRLLDAVAGAQRFAPFARELAAHFDLELGRMRDLLVEIQTQAGWRPGDGHTVIAFRDFEAGPGAGGLHAGLVRMAAGAQIPRHRHLSREFTYVLQGSLTDGEGRTYRPGDAIDSAPQSIHTLTAGAGEETIVATLVGQSEGAPG